VSKINQVKTQIPKNLGSEEGDEKLMCHFIYSNNKNILSILDHFIRKDRIKTPPPLLGAFSYPQFFVVDEH